MLPAPTSDPVWIAEPRDLHQMVRALAGEPCLAVDTESNSLFAYQERVCLIQFSTLTVDYLVDPLALQDLSSLEALFSNPDQLKIFHASEYDLICLKRDYGFEVSPVFDTMMAARILGEAQVGLGNLLSLRFGIELNKKYQRANWGTRPLPQVMRDYARLDTHYLFALQELLENELKEKGLWELALEDFRLASDVDLQSASTNGSNCWKVAGSARITGHEAAILQELCRYRDEQARKADLPHFKVLANELLVELCQKPPHSMDELQEFRHLNTRLLRKHGAGLLHAIEVGEAARPVTREKRTRPDDAFMKRLEALKNWRKEFARELKVESDVVLPRTSMEEIAAKGPRTIGDLQQVMENTPWRFTRYGVQILRVLNGGSKKNEDHI